MKIYKSKIGFLVIFVAIVLIGTSIPMLLEDEILWYGLLFNILFFIFFLYISFDTKYILDGKVLHIKSGFFYNKKIDILTIVKIEETRSILSSPAPSLDRLEIVYNKYDSILISPKEKAVFIAELLKIKPKIKVIYRNK